MSVAAYDESFKACDLMSLSGVLKVSDLDMVLLGANSPRAAWGSKAYNEVMLLSGEPDFSFRGRFALPTEWCLIGYIHHATEGGWCHGTPLTTDSAFTVLPEGVSEFVLAADSQISLMLLPLAWLRGSYAKYDPHSVELPARSLSLFKLSGDARSARLRGYFTAVRQALVLGAGDIAVLTPDIETVSALLADHLGAALASHDEDHPHYSRGRRAHYLILQRTEHFMRANLRRDIYINEMCNAAGVSERALRYAFEDLLGVSPNRYLSLLRLCTACRSLSLADASRRSVKSVALSCGLWDLSRFADNYRRVFGELPRDTLMRNPPRESSSSYP